jgi:predicted N-acetyltransferase YhbS
VIQIQQECRYRSTAYPQEERVLVTQAVQLKNEFATRRSVGASSRPLYYLKSGFHRDSHASLKTSFKNQFKRLFCVAWPKSIIQT